MQYVLRRYEGENSIVKEKINIHVKFSILQSKNI
jgi:hypothetical protein